jgi:transposase
MEACGGSAYWTRVIESCGHTVQRIHPRFIKPYLMADKNDAAAICEAVQRPHMRFVPNKTQEQADVQAIHRVRQRLIQARTATLNQVRGLLVENGIVFGQGACQVRDRLPGSIADEGNELSGVMRGLLTSLYEGIAFLDEQIEEHNQILLAIANERRGHMCRPYVSVPIFAGNRK